ncbi:flagellar hook protein FlgE [Alteromonas sp. S015]|uniref:flagellar hook protein FlgE n=1 Tax=Alteromonas sp. S015 TaxID=3117401 RepID=UPI002FDF91CC
MSMLSIGLSGLQSTQSALEVTSNNIANASTSGFKEVTTQFASVYSGGQRGGVSVADLNENFNVAGELVSTGSALDVAISGNGFYVVDEGAGQLAYTQAGQFELDANLNIVNAFGNQLQGYSVDENGNVITGVLDGLSLNSSNIPADPTDEVAFALNVDSSSPEITIAFDPTDGGSYNYSQSTQVYDSLGNSHTLTQYYVHSGTNTWDVHYYFNGGALGATETLNFNPDGSLNTAVPGVVPPINITIPAATVDTGANDINLSIDMTDTTQFGSGFSLYRNDADGYTAGEFAGISIEKDGSVLATFTNGETLLQGQIVLATFANLNGLENANNTSWYATAESGDALYGTPEEGNFGELLAGAYVGSNVNISEQLVDLLAFQQSYQANARTVSSADEMMQVLFNAV